jgi:transposase
MAKRTTICAGIDTGKHKLDVAMDGSSEQLQVDNVPEGYKVLSDWLLASGEACRDRGEWRL